MPVTSAAAGTPPPPNTDDGAVNLRSFGAVGDGSTDDGPALQSALNALLSQHGGTLVVPPGRYAIATPVSVYGSGSGDITIQGVGSSSQFLLKVGGGHTALQFNVFHRVVIERMTFLGTPNVYPDLLRAIDFELCWFAVMRECELFGLNAQPSSGSQTPAGVIYSYATDLLIQNCAFWGCSANGSTSAIECAIWGGLHMEDVIMWDIGDLNGVTYAKSAVNTYAAVHLGDAAGPINHPPGPQHSSSQRQVRLIRVSTDEGYGRGFALTASAGNQARSVLLDNLQVNGFAPSSGIGAMVQGSRNTMINDCWFGYTKSSSTAISLKDAGDATIAGTICQDGMTTIKADSTTTSLTVINSSYTSLQSSAGVTNVIDHGRVATPVNFENVTTVPASGPTNGGLLYAEAGNLKWRGPTGKITTIAPA